MRLSSFVVDFSDLDWLDLDLIGKKSYLLSELKSLGVPIPDGFVITTSFFKEFLEVTGISTEIKKIQSLSHPAIVDSMFKLFHLIQKKIMNTPIPQNLATEIHNHYRKLSGALKEQSLNIFTSPLKGKSFYFSDIKGDANLILKIKEIWTSHLNNHISIVVQKNIKSKIKGKIFTNDPLINDQNLMKLAKKIQKHFYFPQELDYVIEKGKIYITRIKPFTGTISEKPKKEPITQRLKKILIKGSSVNPGIAIGPARIFNQALNAAHIKKDEIIVLPKLDISLYKNLKKAKAVIIETILSNSYDKMLYRKDIKIPTIEGTKNATKILQNGNIITVNGISGEIYQGGLI